MSVISFGTAFKPPNKVFEDFKASRTKIAQRLGNIREKKFLDNYDNTGEFLEGYSELSQDVIIPAFLAAYTNYTPKNVPLENFPKFPFPKWMAKQRYNAK